MRHNGWALEYLSLSGLVDYRPAEQLVAADKTDTGSQQLVYPPIIARYRTAIIAAVQK